MGGTAYLNEEPSVHLFWTTLQSIATSGISRVLEYSIKSSTEYSGSKKFDSSSPIGRETINGDDCRLRLDDVKNKECHCYLLA